MILALDCDLRKSYGAASCGWTGRGASPGAVIQAKAAHLDNIDVILFEIASPTSFNRQGAGTDSRASIYQLAKWAIWNVAQAQAVNFLCLEAGATLLVSPSSVWTKGHKLEVRHAMAMANDPKKDVREAQAMLWFYSKCPQDWQPLELFLASL